MSKLTQTLIEDVLKSKEDIKRVLNENIQSVFKDVIKEGLSELLEKEDESFDNEEILSKEDNKESDTNDTEEFNDLNSITSDDEGNVSTELNDYENETGDQQISDVNDNVGDEGYGELETIDLTSFDTDESYDIFMQISDDAIANMVSDEQLELIDTKTNKKFIFKKTTLEECLIKNKEEVLKENEDYSYDDLETQRNKTEGGLHENVFGGVLGCELKFIGEDSDIPKQTTDFVKKSLDVKGKLFYGGQVMVEGKNHISKVTNEDGDEFLIPSKFLKRIKNGKLIGYTIKDLNKEFFLTDEEWQENQTNLNENEDDVIYEIVDVENNEKINLFDVFNENMDINEEDTFEVQFDDEDEEGVDLEETAFAGSKTFQTGMKQHGKFSTQRSKQVSRNTIGENKKIELLEKKLNESHVKISNLVEEKIKLKKIVTESVSTLKEVSLTYTNLLNATRLIQGFTTTKDEKTQILEKFDACKTINESNELYNQLKNKLNENVTIINKDVIVEKKKVKDKNLILEKTSFISSDLQSLVGDLMSRMDRKN
jgi:hypothetical protein